MRLQYYLPLKHCRVLMSFLPFLPERLEGYLLHRLTNIISH